MQPNSPQLDEHGFPIPPTFAGAGDPRGRVGRVGRHAWRTALVLVFMVLLGTAAVRHGVVDSVKELLVQQFLHSAQKQALQDDLPGALAKLDWVVAWAPDEPDAFEMRARCRLGMNDLQGSLADFNRVIELDGRSASAYSGRGGALLRLNRQREAIDDLTQAIKLSPEHDPGPRNDRAYFRAIAGIELQEGLDDVNAALALVQSQLNAIPTEREHPRMRLFRARPNREKAMYLDTRGTLYLLLGENDKALSDLEEALDLAEDSMRVMFDQHPYVQRIRSRELAVMYHHRGQIHQMLGNTEQAQRDLRRGQELGYNPADGVY
ncbi:MAG TPA: hypothetical protein VND64_34690 [Pirellulales bacterium]|nr:hypothetical protein [Pirellulales bacterium]